jgi:hypothetical protein
MSITAAYMNFEAHSAYAIMGIGGNNFVVQLEQ